MPFGIAATGCALPIVSGPPLANYARLLDGSPAQTPLHAALRTERDHQPLVTRATTSWNLFIAARRAARNGPAHCLAARYRPSGLLHEMQRLQKLFDEPSTKPAHARLIAESVGVLPGDRVYRCKDCATRWLRPLDKRGTRKPQVWIERR
jgi:hypothetical protein